MASNGLPILNDILSSSSHGVSSTFWYGSGGGAWSDGGQTPQAMSATQAYTPLAANANAFVYAMQDGGIKEFVVAVDGTINLVGDVVTV